MTEASTEARINTAADDIEREGGKPTVASVRERAGVNNADATRYLRGWREGRASSGATIAALPAALVEQSQRVAGLMWTEASSLASASHAAVEREWRAQAATFEVEIAELVENLDEADRSASATAEAHTSERAAHDAELLLARTDEARAKAELQAAEQAKVELEKEFAEERATSQTLRETLAALIARIPAAEAGK
ncbi:KfrA protein [Cryobacterium sp. TMT1-2-2]|uniref:DNA-binding protein n=1 Tax=Cryobacterium sp. TMT1-2-2 TaxID=1259233 RepID=UPI0010692DBD|nr:DNA-binding protein [Cryobacterium sp. TMT1-2-2]TFD12875.1 KfrA protein [Cryobacterium sp. TMT1-2-2]